VDINQVIQAGHIGFFHNYGFIPWYLGVIPVLLIILGIILYNVLPTHKEYSWMDGGYVDTSPFIVRFLSWAGGIGLLLYFVVGNVAGAEASVDQWKNDVAYPYIHSLPDEKAEIVYVKIDPEIKTEIRGRLYIYSTSSMLTPLTISFKANGVETYTNWFDTSMSLTDHDRPYITFKRLRYNLGNGVEAGMYQPMIYLPETYKFTDIK
jgi:hypothetical protein